MRSAPNARPAADGCGAGRRTPVTSRCSTRAGHPRADLPRMFEPFFTTRRTGSGLGLALARNVVEGLGGSIAIESQVTVGTPVRIDSSRRRRAHDPRFRAARRRRGENPGGAVRALADDGHDVVATGSPRHALRLLNERPFDFCSWSTTSCRSSSGLELIRRWSRPWPSRTPANRDDDGARHHRKRDRGDEARRARLPPEAVRDRRVPGRAPGAPSSTSGCASITTTSSPSATSSSATTASSAGAAGFRRSSARRAGGADRSTVLITGETGTGKELVARAIHDRSAPARQAVRQGQLRGDARDAARVRAVRPRARRVHRRRRRRKTGLFELADGGTIFLDEIGTLSPSAAGEAAARARRSASSSRSASERTESRSTSA